MARLITNQEAEKIGKRPFGKKHFVHALIEQLKKGETLLILRSDFQWHRQTPGIFVNRIMKSTNKKFIIYETADRSGWIVERTE